MIWLDPTSPAVRSAVVSGAWGKAPHTDHAWPVAEAGEIDTITDALQVASEILQRYTGFTIHPAGTAVETFIATLQVRRLSPTFTPLRTLVSVTRQNTVEGVVELDPATWGVTNNSILFTPEPLWDWPLEWYYRRILRCVPPGESTFTVEYQFGSTITAGARRAVITLAHQFYLETSSCESCELPGRTTSVLREGLTLDLDTTALRSQLGLPEVDAWLDAVNPNKATRRPGVWTPDSPPPAVKSLRSARPDWMGTARSGGANLGVGVVTS